MTTQKLLDLWLTASAHQDAALSIYCDLRDRLGTTHRRTVRAHSAWTRCLHYRNAIADKIRAELEK